jgi:hypothetical protein
MHLPALIKKLYKHSYSRIIHHFTAYKHKCQNKYIFQDGKGKKFIRNNTRGYETAERGSRFHSTIGSANPNRFTTSHPRDETTML